MSNRLIDEISPYLLQHAHNPVDWYPWGTVALERARDEEKPIFLSVGYSACHWCHVMEQECFSRSEIADQLNQDFIAIKVDREERPDLDQIYMSAVQMLTGRGGWPMSVFLTPDRKPFHAGTYWPPEPRHGLPSFPQVLAAVLQTWKERRPDALSHAEHLSQRIRAVALSPKEDPFALAHGNLLAEAVTKLSAEFDADHGGFGGAPKFPPPMALQFLLRQWHRQRTADALEMVTCTLDRMADGGIWDHLAGGFARYSVDERWAVPHFEKMLYDNGLLAGTYLEAFQALGTPRYAEIATGIFDYVLSSMQDDQGGFLAAEDADTDGKEGQFYVWSEDDIVAVLGEEVGGQFSQAYGVTKEGNFDGQNVLHLPRPLAATAEDLGIAADVFNQQMRVARQRLQQARAARTPPQKDDKIIVSWNGYLIEAMARGGRILGEPRFTQAAARAARFCWERLRTADGGLYRAFRQGQARNAAFLDDYSSLANAMVTLYETTFDESWIEAALELVAYIRRHFVDHDHEAGGAFFYTTDIPDIHETLIARQKEIHDSAVPSSNGLLATVLVRLGKLCGRADFVADARGILDQAAEVMERAPRAVGQLLIALDMIVGPFPEIVLLGSEEDPGTHESLQAFWKRYIPNRVIACRRSHDSEEHHAHGLDPIFLGRIPLYGAPTLFVCHKFACEAPVSGKEAVIGKWGELVALGQTPPR